MKQKVKIFVIKKIVGLYPVQDKYFMRLIAKVVFNTIFVVRPEGGWKNASYTFTPPMSTCPGQTAGG